MRTSSIRGSLEISPEHGSVSTWLCTPSQVRALLVLAHGAGAGMEHGTMNAIADALSQHGIATFRFNFPFMEHRRARPDSRELAMLTLSLATDAARAVMPDVPLLAGGHSFGGRMASHAALDHGLPAIRGLVLCAFPLHPARKPDTARAAHLRHIDHPMLFLSGTRDALAEPGLLARVVDDLGQRAGLVWLDTADHGYRVLKRQRKVKTSVFEEMADAVAGFVDSLTA
jgi:uncharacterized protein